MGLGIRNRDVSTAASFAERVYCVTVASEPGVSSITRHFRFKNSLEATKLVELTASANTAPGGFTTFTIDITNSNASLLTTPLSLDDKSQQVLVGSLAADTRVDMAEVVTISVTVTGVERYSDLLITARFRPLLGREVGT